VNEVMGCSLKVKRATSYSEDRANRQAGECDMVDACQTTDFYRYFFIFGFCA
jgi:hypothetical protein